MRLRAPTRGASTPAADFGARLFSAPTLVHNVETLCAVPWIVEHGADAYASLGFSESRGTKLLSLNSLFRQPGLYEVEFGLSLADVCENLGGGLRRGRLKGVMVGGPLAGIVPPDLLGVSAMKNCRPSAMRSATAVS